MISPIRWVGDATVGHVEMIDQRLLPTQTVFVAYHDVAEVAEAIRALVIRGAPAIGIAAAMGMVLAARALPADLDREATLTGLEGARALLAGTRPTAVNLFWALERVDRVAREHLSARGAERAALVERLLAEARAVRDEDVAMNRAMGLHGATLFAAGARILTHCNTGGLATGGLGTALGVIRACHERARESGGPDIHVWVDETRPYLQGARLTAWECVSDGIPATLITDSTAGWLMRQGKVDAVITGADRVVANGDVANKIGTYSLAVLCRHHGIPFYVAIPTSTLDLQTADGAGIVIEQRSAREIRFVGPTQIAPEIDAAHPAFDVTPHELVTAIVTEHGIARAPYTESLRAMAATTRGGAA